MDDKKNIVLEDAIIRVDGKDVDIGPHNKLRSSQFVEMFRGSQKKMRCAFPT